MAKRIDDDQLKSILQNELSSALGIEGGQLSEDRRRLLALYQGKPLGNEVEGQSQVVTREVFETIEWIIPSLIRLFVQNDTVAEFLPYRPEEEAVADQASQYVNYILTVDNDFFSILLDWLKDALIQRSGYVRCFWDEQKMCQTSTYTGLDDAELEQITSQPDTEVLSQVDYPNPLPVTTTTPQMPQRPAPGALMNGMARAEGAFTGGFTAGAGPMPGMPPVAVEMLHDIVVKQYRTEGRCKIENLPPESVLVSKNASRVLDGNHFVCVRSEKRVTDLRELGFSDDLIEEACGSTIMEWSAERMSRYEGDDDMLTDNRTDEAMRTVWVEENFVKVDRDGDGRAELRRIVTAQNASVIFSDDPCDEVPIIAITPIPLPHRHNGLGLSDLVADLQIISSQLTREMLNNLYLSNSPRFLVAEAALTSESIDDILAGARPGGIVRVNDVMGIKDLQVPFVAGQTLPILEQISNLMEMRTGVSRHNVGMSPDDLNRHTATGISLLQQAANQRVELIARIIAETGVKVLCQRVLSQVVRHQQQARVVRLTGKEWQEFDVRHWRDNFDVRCSVGLGTGNRDATLGHLTQILQVQQQIVASQGGVQGPLVNADNIYNVLTKLVANAGFRGEQFFSDPKMAPPAPPQQNPAMMKAEAESKATQMRTESQIAADQAKNKNDLALEQARAAHDMQIQAMKNQQQIELQQMREQAKAEMAILNRQNTVERTVVTKHDANGRILEFEKHQVPVNSDGAGL